MAQRGPSRPLAGTKATNCCSIHFHVVAIRGRLLLCLGLGNSFLLFGGLCFLLIAALLFRLLLRRLFLRCLLLLLGRRGLRLFQDLVRHLGELLALLLHVGTQEHRLIILRQGVLFVLHLAKPLFELSACRRNRGKLLRRNVPKLVSRSLDGIPVVRDRARDGLDPLLPHAGLLEAPCDGVADPLQLVDLVDEHGLGSIERVIQPVLGLSQVAGESLPLGCRDEVFVDARLRALVAHVEDVSFQVVFLLVRLDDVAHLRLHRALGIHELLQHLGAQAGATRGGDLEVSLLGALFRFLDLHPLVLLLGLCLLFLLLRGLLFVGGALFVFFSVAVGLLRVVAAAILGGLLLRVAVLLGGGLHLDIGLDLRGRGLLAGLDRNLALFLHNLLVLLLFNHLSTLDGESAMKRETSPDLDFLGLGLGRQLNVEGAELLRRHWQKGLLVGKFGLNVERGLPEERQGLQKVHRRARREHRRAFELAFDFGHPLVAILLLGLLGRWSMTHPTNVDGERRRVLHLEVPDFVQRRQDRSLQGATSCDTLLLVHGRRQLLLAVLAAESLGAELFHPGHAGTAADHFHNVDLFHCQA
mmetsp:Transcript_73752/g.240193  ORF Transcript_73752/g.240193 Transcript_73752/m.240193 type:complete len:584 (+) Transcript_73752:280-2031(+)